MARYSKYFDNELYPHFAIRIYCFRQIQELLYLFLGCGNSIAFYLVDNHTSLLKWKVGVINMLLNTVRCKDDLHFVVKLTLPASITAL